LKSLTLIKIGALGDVVRTSYLVNALKNKYNYIITWITEKSAEELLKYNPNIDRILYLDSDLPKETDILICLEDKYEYVKLGNQIKSKRTIGSYIDDNNLIKYSDDSRDWFDMSLISKQGISMANDLKKKNTKSFNQIFSKILHVQISDIKPELFYNEKYYPQSSECEEKKIVLGLNLFAGNRWPSKELHMDDSKKLIESILDYLDDNKIDYILSLFCDNSSHEKAKNIVGDKRLNIINTNADILDFSGHIRKCDLFVTTDSLGMHLAIANKTRHIAFFNPTSAVEIDNYNHGVKVISESLDYCSYKPDAAYDNTLWKKIFDQWLIEVDKLVFKN
tara:strand:+ start:17888 stop:18892 length:1005 start_codon:yes stop_codon:yes gene_type:complete